MTTVVINPEIALINIADGHALTVEESKATLLSVFMDMSGKHPTMLPLHAYENNGRKATLTIGIIDGKHLCPSLNFVAIPSLQCELTSLLKARSIGFLQLAKQHVEALRAMRQTKDISLSSVVRWATLAIGTCGSRVTNRDMSYEVHIEYLPTDQILSILAPYVKIINKDKSNRMRSFGYVLTCREEVEAFMTACGLADVYLNALAKVESYQEQHGLKAAYDGERIDDNAKPMTYKIALVA